MWKQRLGRVRQAGFISLIVLVISAAACADENKGTKTSTKQGGDRISADISTEQTVQLTPSERAAISHAAARMLLHANQARSALADEDIAAANDNIGKGLQLLDIINEALPEYKVTSTISAGDLTYNDESRVKPGRIPLYTSYGELSIINDVSKTNDPKPDSTVVTDAEDYLSTASLDVHAARRNFIAARTAIDGDELTDADQFLANVLGSLAYEVVEVEEPLVAARENLTLAGYEVEDQRLRAARLALEEASRQLEQDADRLAGKGASELHGMAAEMKRYAAEIEDDSKGASEKIDAWYDRLTGFDASVGRGSAAG